MLHLKALYVMSGGANIGCSEVSVLCGIWLESTLALSSPVRGVTTSEATSFEMADPVLVILEKNWRCNPFWHPSHSSDGNQREVNLTVNILFSARMGIILRCGGLSDISLLQPQSRQVLMLVLTNSNMRR